MASRTSVSEHTLQIKRTFAATREKVFRAWTNPEEVKKWFGPEGYATPSVEIELRTGGKYRFGMKKLPDGELFYLSGVFREVKPSEKLVYTWQWEGGEGPQAGETLVTVEFRTLGSSTEVILTHEFFPTDEARKGHEMGWGSCLDGLAKIL